MSRRSRRPALSADDPRHGSVNGYTNHRCRCSPCREANRGRQEKLRATRDGNLDPFDPAHGTANGYDNHRCRCGRCREFVRVRSVARRAAARYATDQIVVPQVGETGGTAQPDEGRELPPMILHAPRIT